MHKIYCFLKEDSQFQALMELEYQLSKLCLPLTSNDTLFLVFKSQSISDNV